MAINGSKSYSGPYLRRLLRKEHGHLLIKDVHDRYGSC